MIGLPPERVIGFTGMRTEPELDRLSNILKTFNDLLGDTCVFERDLRARASRQQLKADFETYLDGFSPNVQDILENFEFPQPDPAALEGQRPRHADSG